MKDVFYLGLQKLKLFRKQLKNIFKNGLLSSVLVRTEVRRIELPSQPWQGHVLTVVLHLRILEGPAGFEPAIVELQSNALPAWL